MENAGRNVKPPLSKSYEALLLANGLIDFDGLVLVGLELIERYEWVRRSIKAKYPVMVIDEYQDLGLPLHRMVLALMNKAGVRIIAVGDPDQSIYGFTGAKPSLLRTLEGLPSVEPIRLKLNYRCADQIIAASRSLLTDPAEFQSHDGRQGEIRIYQLNVTSEGKQTMRLEQSFQPCLNKTRPGSPVISRCSIEHLTKEDQ